MEVLEAEAKISAKDTKKLESLLSEVILLKQQKKDIESRWLQLCGGTDPATKNRVQGILEAEFSRLGLKKIEHAGYKIAARKGVAARTSKTALFESAVRLGIPMKKMEKAWAEAQITTEYTFIDVRAPRGGREEREEEEAIDE